MSGKTQAEAAICHPCEACPLKLSQGGRPVQAHGFLLGGQVLSGILPPTAGAMGAGFLPSQE